jgi:hypothetical protein
MHQGPALRLGQREVKAGEDDRDQKRDDQIVPFGHHASAARNGLPMRLWRPREPDQTLPAITRRAQDRILLSLGWASRPCAASARAIARHPVPGMRQRPLQDVAPHQRHQPRHDADDDGLGNSYLAQAAQTDRSRENRTA